MIGASFGVRVSGGMLSSGQKTVLDTAFYEGGGQSSPRNKSFVLEGKMGRTARLKNLAVATNLPLRSSNCLV
jgi:hypothetical protein